MLTNESIKELAKQVMCDVIAGVENDEKRNLLKRRGIEYDHEAESFMEFHSELNKCTTARIEILTKHLIALSGFPTPK